MVYREGILMRGFMRVCAGFEVNIMDASCGFVGFTGFCTTPASDLADAKLYIGVGNNPQKHSNPQSDISPIYSFGNDNEEDRCCSLAECVPGDIVTHLDGSRWKVVRTGSYGAAWLGAGAMWLGPVDADLDIATNGDLRPVIAGSPFGEEFYCLGHYDPDAPDWYNFGGVE
ncbi:hypothetical protein [Sphingobium yanoikuyae]|uniref:hypothetical protein n=1 Tax=Sphingobium yanoikuyae TaxID=13690 RepID=UPI0028A7C350|nr:hypothetical protein [Sphingobium yanoikuyae]